MAKQFNLLKDTWGNTGDTSRRSDQIGIEENKTS